MELKIKIGYDELLKLVQQLPQDQITSLKKELDKFVKESSSKEVSNLKQLALSGPIMTDTQLTNFQEFRKQFSNWREE